MQQRELIEQVIVQVDTDAVPMRNRAVVPRRSVTVNISESPLAWLKSRQLIDSRQFEAGERLRADYERAALATSTTMRWDGAPRQSGRAAGGASDRWGAQIDAKARFDRALDAVGAGLRNILWRVVCACEPLPCSEKALGWPARSGRIVLGIALDRLADAYGLRLANSEGQHRR